ncbi:MAG: DNA-binding response regulator [Cyclobacteriaceae bacterium]
MSQASDIPVKLLVVDDDSANFKVVLENFQTDFYDVMYAPNGRAGCEVAEKELPDIILMDWDMPVMNGLDALKQLKSKVATREIPVLMVTGAMTDSGDLKEALESGAIDFIRKPYDSLELVARVKAAYRLYRSHLLVMERNEEIRSLMIRKIGYKDRELLLEVMHRLENSNFITHLGERLSEIEKTCNDERTIQDFLKLRKTIENYLRTENNWENFTIHFKRVHPQFFSSLLAQFPQITSNEQRLCAYIKIGLNNKEIAQLLGVTVGTTKTNLNRLKKKLALRADESLRDFIINFSFQVSMPDYL